MIKYFLTLLIITNAPANELLDSENLKNQLYKLVFSSHRPINYKNANEIIFTKIDNHKGAVCSVYSSKNCLSTTIVPSPKIMNIEHTWPQSEGANGEAKSDLHHLFPVESSVNSIRSSLPFCEVQTVKWTNDVSKRGLSLFNEHCFEPPAEHAGNVARALFYFAIRYQKRIDQNQEYFLRRWDKLDPVDQDEFQRNQSIKGIQGNSNPFIDDSELIDKIIDL